MAPLSEQPSSGTGSATGAPAPARLRRARTSGRSVFLRALRRIGIDVSRFIVFREGLDLCPASALQPPLAELRLAVIEDPHMPLLAALPDRHASVAVMQARQRRGDLCLGAFLGDTLVACSWVFHSHIYFGSYRLPLERREAYLFDTYVKPDLRGFGIASFLRAELYRRLASQGRTRVYSISLAGNQPAIRFKEKLGAVPVDRGISIRLFGRWRIGTHADAHRLRSAQQAAQPRQPA